MRAIIIVLFLLMSLAAFQNCSQGFEATHLSNMSSTADTDADSDANGDHQETAAHYQQGFEQSIVKSYSRSEFNSIYSIPENMNTSESMMAQAGCYTKSNGASYNNIEIVTKHARTGAKSLRLENHSGDPTFCVANQETRARQEIFYGRDYYEFSANHTPPPGDMLGWDHGTETWIGFSLYLPASENSSWWSDSNSSRMLIFQIFGDDYPTSVNSSPIVHLLLGKDGRLDLDNAYGTGTSELTRKFNAITNLKQNEWNDIVVHYKKHYIASKALIEVWHQGIKVLTVDGKIDGLGNAPKKFRRSEFKMGWYRGLEDAPGYTYVGYWDDVRLYRGANGYNRVSPQIVASPPSTLRKIWFDGDFESGLVQAPSSRKDGFRIGTLLDPQVGASFVSSPKNGDAKASLNWDTRIVKTETVDGETISPRAGLYFLRSALYKNKFYEEINGGQYPNYDLDKPRSWIYLSDPAHRFDFDTESWFGMSVYLPLNWQSETQTTGDPGAVQILSINPYSASRTAFQIDISTWPGASASSWTLNYWIDENSTLESAKANHKANLGLVASDLGKWTDFVIHFRSNPYAVPTNPFAMGIADAINKTFQGNKGILEVWKADGAVDASGNRPMKLVFSRINQPVGLAPWAENKLLYSPRMYKYGWKKNPSSVTKPVWMGFDEIRFGLTERDGSGYFDVLPKK